MHLVHGSPRKVNEYLFEDKPARLYERLAAAETADVLVFGHTHKPWVRDYGGVLFVNCGSVGKPKDGDPRGAFAVLEATDAGVARDDRTRRLRRRRRRARGRRGRPARRVRRQAARRRLAKPGLDCREPLAGGIRTALSRDGDGEACLARIHDHSDADHADRRAEQVGERASPASNLRDRASQSCGLDL